MKNMLKMAAAALFCMAIVMLLPGKSQAAGYTCTESGLTEGKHCSVCGAVTVAQQPISASGHSEVTDAGKAATCTESGLTEGKHCSVCGAVTVAQQPISAHGHSYWGVWSAGKQGYHWRYCRYGCGRRTTAQCQLLTAVAGDVTLSVCPICGSMAEGEAERLGKAGAKCAADHPGTFIARAWQPEEGQGPCIALITAVYERGGKIASPEENAEFTLTLPMELPAGCRLVHVTADPASGVQTETPMEFTAENGKLIFTTRQLGLFLVLAE